MHWVHWEHNIIGFTMMVLLHTKLRSPLMIPWRSTFLGCKEKGIERQIKLVWSCNTLLHSSSVSCFLMVSFSMFFIYLFIYFYFYFFWKEEKMQLITLFVGSFLLQLILFHQILFSCYAHSFLFHNLSGVVLLQHPKIIFVKTLILRENNKLRYEMRDYMLLGLTFTF